MQSLLRPLLGRGDPARRVASASAIANYMLVPENIRLLERNMDATLASLRAVLLDA